MPGLTVFKPARAAMLRNQTPATTILALSGPRRGLATPSTDTAWDASRTPKDFDSIKRRTIPALYTGRTLLSQAIAANETRDLSRATQFERRLRTQPEPEGAGCSGKAWPSRCGATAAEEWRERQRKSASECE
eukprot:733454-Rhodomonas_salina.1